MLDTRIAWFALGALVVLAVVIRIWLRRMVRARRAEVNARIEISGFLTALLAGITKVRVAHAERRVYTRWATMFARQQTAVNGSNAANQRLMTAVVMLPGLSSLLVVAVATYIYDAELSLGAFVGLVVALTQVTTAIALVVPALGQLTEAVPMWDSAGPSGRPRRARRPTPRTPARCSVGSSQQGVLPYSPTRRRCSPRSTCPLPRASSSPWSDPREPASRR